MIGSAYANVLPEPVGDIAIIDSRLGVGIWMGIFVLVSEVLSSIMLFCFIFLRLREDCSFSINLVNKGIVCD